MMTKTDIQTVLDELEMHVPYYEKERGCRAIAILQASLAEPSEPVAWSESAIDEYLDGYSLIGDDGDYTPSDDEKFVIKDAIIGFMSATRETKNSPSIEDIQQAVARGWRWRL